MLTLEKDFAATHVLNGVPVMRNPNWVPRSGVNTLWVDAEGNILGSGVGRKAFPIPRHELPVATVTKQGGKFGKTYGTLGEAIPTEWWLTTYVSNHSARGVMVTREAAAAALRACAWPDSSAPCGLAGNSNDDDAAFEGMDEAGNCIVRLFMRGYGYFRVRIPKAMFLEIVDE